MTVEQPEIPPPLPDGYATWLDGLVAALDEMRFAMAHYFYRNGARAELAELRQKLETEACLRANADEMLGRLSGEKSNLELKNDKLMHALAALGDWAKEHRRRTADLDAQRAGAVRERDEARDHLKTSWSDCVATARERDEARAKLAEAQEHLDAQSKQCEEFHAEALGDLAEAEAKLAELREAALKLGTFEGVSWEYPDSTMLIASNKRLAPTVVVEWNAKIAKLRAEQGGEEAK